MREDGRDEHADVLHALTLRYLDGDLLPEELQALRDQLANDADSAMRFVELVQLACMVREQAQRAEGLRKELSLPIDRDVNSIAVLNELMRLERQAPILDSRIAFKPAPTQPSQEKHDTMGWSEVAGATSYLLANMMKSAPAKWLATAAAVLLAATLFFVFNSSDEPDRVVEELPEVNVPPVVSPTAVAMLTNTHKAEWLGPELRVGDGFESGRRLELIAGFAEITTERGAIVMVQAPATIELIDNNALRLHVGKLVGICETESSRGLLVRTPNMDVTDLGTRFGVDASEADITDVHVFDGKVMLDRQATGHLAGARQYVVAGQAVRATAGTVGFSSISVSQEPFVARFAFEAATAQLALVAIWQFEDRQHLGRDTRSGLDLLHPIGDATYTAGGRFGGGLQLDGDGDAMLAPIFPDGIPTGNESFTVAMWIKPTATGRRGLFSWGEPRTFNRMAGARLHGENGIVYWFWEQSANQDLAATGQAVADTGTDFSAGGWTHVALTWDGQVRKIYLNGLLVASGTREAPDIAAEHFELGRSPNARKNYDYFSGTLDDVMVFNRSLGHGAIVALMDEALPRTR